MSSDQNKEDYQTGSCCSSAPSKTGVSKTVIAAAGLALLTGLSYVLPLLEPFREVLFRYIQVIWWAILLGLVLGGVIDHYIPRSYVAHVLARRQKRTIFKAVVLGFFMSACSHGILALAIQLYKKGASTASVIAFLLASPWANLPLTLMLIGFFGVTSALYIILSAVVIAVITGMLYQVFEQRGWVECNPDNSEHDPDFSIAADIRRRRREYVFSRENVARDVRGVVKGSVALSDMVLWWILLGIGIASLAGAYIPTEVFYQYLGPSLLGMVLTLVLATVLEVCSEGTAPLAFEIYRQTGAVGNSLIFLTAGVATDYTEIGLIWHNIGRRAAILLPLITVPQIFVWGIVANHIF
ncbi:MAG: permease [Candidatus Omnitrophota bacterium]